MFESNQERKDLINLLELMDEVVGQPNCSNFPDAFFTEQGSGNNGDYEIARSLCATCPIKIDCLDFAVKHPQQGVWGGTSPAERRALRVKISARHASARNAQGQPAPTTKPLLSILPVEQPFESEQHF